MTPARAHSVTGGGLTPRDVQVVELVGRFRIMSAEQIRRVVFSSQVSKTPLDRALARLTAGGYLARLARFVGGLGGGSGSYVYQLGRVGWRYLGKGGGYRPLRVVDLHTLTITECFVLLKEMELAGRLGVVTFEAEPASHLNVAGTPLTPDAYVELGDAMRKLKYRFWLEIDRNTENAETIKGKCVRYWHAYEAWDESVFPYIAFVAPDAARGREIQRVIEAGPADAHELFKIFELDSFAEDIHRNMR